MLKTGDKLDMIMKNYKEQPDEVTEDPIKE